MRLLITIILSLLTSITYAHTILSAAVAVNVNYLLQIMNNPLDKIMGRDKFPQAKYENPIEAAPLRLIKNNNHQFKLEDYNLVNIKLVTTFDLFDRKNDVYKIRLTLLPGAGFWFYNGGFHREEVYIRHAHVFFADTKQSTKVIFGKVVRNTTKEGYPIVDRGEKNDVILASHQDHDYYLATIKPIELLVEW